MVDSQTACAIRQAVATSCADAFPQLGRQTVARDNWNDSIDEAVYTTSGLRMIGSHKERGDLKHVYTPRWALGQGSQMSRIDSPVDWRAMVKRCSIRSDASARTTLRLQLAPSPKTSPKPVPETSSSLLPELAALHDVLPSAFAGCRFTKMKRAGHTFFLQSDSRYCLNVEREHGSCTVWFQLQRDGVTQRCHSPKSGDDRMMGCCKRYRSNTFPMPARLKEVLWPN